MNEYDFDEYEYFEPAQRRRSDDDEVRVARLERALAGKKRLQKQVVRARNRARRRRGPGRPPKRVR